jgi:acyl-CoA reductase-like NAD-dependent aldehyde dehydrogenase
LLFGLLLRFNQWLQYGGMKSSGTGREGVRYAIEEFSELKTLVLRDIGSLDNID